MLLVHCNFVISTIKNDEWYKQIFDNNGNLLENKDILFYFMQFVYRYYKSEDKYSPLTLWNKLKGNEFERLKNGDEQDCFQFVVSMLKVLRTEGIFKKGNVFAILKNSNFLVFCKK